MPHAAVSGDAAGAPRGNLEVAAAPAPVGSAKRRTDASTAPSSCTSHEDDAARVARVAAPTRDADEAVRRNAPKHAEPSSEHAEPRRDAETLSTRISGSADGAGDSKPVTPETARRREVIARAMAVAAAAAEAKAAEQRLAAKEARAAAARRAKARIRGEASPEKPEALSARDGDGVRGVGVSPSSPVETRPRADADVVATYATRVQGLELDRRRRAVSTDVKDSDDGGVASGDASGENRVLADGGVIADAARTLWGGLWGDVKSASRGRGETINPYGAEENLGGPPGAAGFEGSRSRRSGARGNEGGAKFASVGAAATRKARLDAKKRAHKAQVASARAADASGITGWACDEESFFEYESVDGPFMPGAVAESHAPSFGDAPRPAPAPRDWTRVKARVVCRRDAEEEE